MPINLKKNNISSLIISLIKEQKIGILSVKTPVTKSHALLLNTNNDSFRKPQNASTTIENNFLIKEFFFYSGTITYGFGNNQFQPARLKDYLMCYQLESKVDEYLTDSCIDKNTDKTEYDCLIWLLQKKYLKPQQMREVLSKLIKENILELFISEHSQANFQENYSLDPICHSSITINTICRLNNLAKTWKLFEPFIVSPNQYIYLKNRTFLKENISSTSYANITKWSQSQKTLIELSRQLNCSVVDIGQAFYPYVKKRLIVLKTNS